MGRIAGLLLLMVVAGCAGGGGHSEVGGETGVETGLASFYAHKYHGRQTASGEIYDMNAMTAAHRTLPFGTRVRVTNRENGRKVELRINDRGPFVDGRIIDVSLKAAGELDFIEQGVVKVRVEVLDSGD